MSLEFRSFAIREGSAEEDEARLAGFLRSVEVSRIDTAFADGAWRVLVHFKDLRRKEERAQIESAIVQALNSWRNDIAKANGIDRDSVLSPALVTEVARYAPTTEIELSVITSALGGAIGPYGADVVRVVRQTMEDLTEGEF